MQNLEHALSIAMLAFACFHAVAHGAAKAADVYVSWALRNDDPSDDARARKIAVFTGRALKTLDWLAGNLPTIRRGVGS